MRFLPLAVAVAFSVVLPAQLRAQVGVTLRSATQQNRMNTAGSSLAPRSMPCWLPDDGCEASEFKAVAQKRENGKALNALGGLAFYAGDIWLPFSGDGFKKPVALIAGGGLVWIVGKVWQSAHVSQSTWDGAVRSIRVGETKLDEVKRCLGTPSSTTSDGDTQTNTFTNKMPDGSVSTITVITKAGVVSGVRQTSAVGG